MLSFNSELNKGDPPMGQAMHRPKNRPRDAIRVKRDAIRVKRDAIRLKRDDLIL